MAGSWNRTNIFARVSCWNRVNGDQSAATAIALETMRLVGPPVIKPAYRHAMHCHNAIPVQMYCGLLSNFRGELIKLPQTGPVASHRHHFGLFAVSEHLVEAWLASFTN